MTVDYREHLSRIRQCFPQPISDRMHDAYFVISILRALDDVDAMKSELPLLGLPTPLDYEAARQSRIGEQMQNVEEVSQLLVSRLSGMPIWSHPRTQLNVVAPPSIPSIIGALLPTIYNPNLVSDDSSHGVALAEDEVAAMIARLIGYDAAQAIGIFTFGGTGTMLYGTKIGIEKAMPGAMEQGLAGQAVLLASEQSHYCRLNVAGWLGLGERNVVTVPTTLQSDMRIDLFEQQARRVLQEGRKIAAIVATMGTTDALGIDDLEAIVRVRDKLVGEFQLPYRPHVHADAVIGWAWSVFNDYDFNENPLGFRPRHSNCRSCRSFNKNRLET
jgi:L-2,4-diaminobutyrate decarboxylase